MMYASLADLVARFGEDEVAQISNRAGGHTVNGPVAQQALEDASAEVDGYVGTRYRFADSPPLLVRITCDLARYRLYDDAVPDEIRNRYLDAVRVLRAIADGTVTLGAQAQAPTHAQVSIVCGPPKAFGRAKNGGLQ